MPQNPLLLVKTPLLTPEAEDHSFGGSVSTPWLRWDLARPLVRQGSKSGEAVRFLGVLLVGS